MRGHNFLSALACLHGSPLSSLMAHGLNGKVAVPVVGAFAEMSTDVHSIADFIALVQAEKYCSFYNESLADEKGDVYAAALSHLARRQTRTSTRKV